MVEGLKSRHFILNTQRFPTNITGYRQALVYALDKHAVVESAERGYAVPMDGVIPLPFSFWTYEHQMLSHFYNEDIVKANATLEAAHIIDTPDSPHPGWRYFDTDMSGNWTIGDKRGDIFAPYGLKLWLRVRQELFPAVASCIIQLTAMEKCGLQGLIVNVDYLDFDNLIESGDFNLCCHYWRATPLSDPEWLYSFFHSQGLQNQLWFRYNSSAYDYNVSRMLTAPTKTDARGWAWNCSKQLLQDVPIITCYLLNTIHVYRTDIWDGYVNMTGCGVMGDNPWSLRKVRLKDTHGGPFNLHQLTDYIIALTEGMETTNPLMVNDRFSKRVFTQIYSSLWQIDPFTLERVPDLAHSWQRETTGASGDIQAGEKYTFYLYPNVTWHDGTPFTAADVAYSLDILWPQSPFYSHAVEHIYRIDTPDDFTVEIYTNQSGYFEFTQASSLYILPQHIWNLHTNVTEWVPVSPLDLTGTGPFQFIHRASGQWIQLARFPNYHLGVLRPPLQPYPLPPLTVMAIIIGVIIILSQVALLGILFKRRRKQQMTPSEP
jgi:ABC-type transport system substrate-binding protein